MMHATLDRRAGTEGDNTLFFADLPDPATDRLAVRAAEPPSAYGAGRKLNWPAILTIAALHVVMFVVLVKFDVIVIKPKAKPLVVDLIFEATPPPQVEPPKAKPAPEVPVVQQLVAPPPLVQTLAPPPPQVMVAPPPAKPAPVVVPAAAPSTVSVSDLEEKMIEGKPPRYPMESRRKREEGTVVLRLLVGTDGRVVEASVAQSSGFDRLDQAALQAAHGWRWQPLIRDGRAVEFRGTMPISFGLPSKA